MKPDMVIENGWIVDGMSPSLYRGAVGIRGDKIDSVCIGRARLQGKRVIDANGLCVAPGFIDVHSHADHFFLLDPAMKNKVMQGVTTEIGGNCGSSAYPWNESHAFYIPGKEAEFAWKSFDRFLDALEKCGIAINFGSLIGHDSLGGKAAGGGASSPERADLKKMKRLLAKSLEEGAFGLSTGISARPLEATPFLETLAELSMVAAKRDGVLSVHLRDEGDKILDTLSEAIAVANKSGVSLQISHFKTLDRINWPKQKQALELIGKMRLGGINVHIDCFPYTVGCAPLRVLMPPRLASDDRKFKKHARTPTARAEIEDYVRKLFPSPYSYHGVTFPYLKTPRYQPLQGMDLYSAAKLEGRDPISVILDITLAEGLNRFVYYDCISKSNERAAIKQPGAMVSSDAFPTRIPLYFKNSIIHPRTFGAFPQYLSEFVYKNHILPLPAAIEKITSLPAKKFGLRGRGIINKGAYADITIFDPDNLDPGASLANPCKSPSGIEYVIVNGQIVMEHGEFKGVFPGRALRRGE